MTRELSFASTELQRDSNEIQDGQGALLTFSQVVDCNIVVAVNVSHCEIATNQAICIFS